MRKFESDWAKSEEVIAKKRGLTGSEIHSSRISDLSHYYIHIRYYSASRTNPHSTIFRKNVRVYWYSGTPAGPLRPTNQLAGGGGGGLQPPIGRGRRSRAGVVARWVVTWSAIQLIRPEGWGGVVSLNPRPVGLWRVTYSGGEAYSYPPPPCDLPAASCIVPYLPGTTCRVNEVPLMIGAVLYFQYFILFLCTIAL